MRSLTSIFVALIFVMATATMQAQTKPATTSPLPVSVERVMIHVLTDGKKEFTEDGWIATFIEHLNPSPTNSDYAFLLDKEGSSVMCMYFVHDELTTLPGEMPVSIHTLTVKGACTPKEKE